MAEQPGQFNDKALKAAVRATWGEQRAPENLRRSIAAIALAARPAPPRFRIGPRSLAAAAVLVVGISSVVFQVYRLRPVPPQLPNHYQLSSSLVADLAAKHDRDAYLGSTSMDLAQLGKELSEKLGITVLSASPGPDYHFEGASISTIGNQQAAHLLFKRGSESLSIFSMAADQLPHTNQWAHYDGCDAKHTMAGFVQDGGFYCLTASGPNSARCNGMISGAMQELSSQFPASTQPAK